MTAKALYTMFSDLFPNLAEECKSYKSLAQNVIDIRRKDKGSYMFIYRSNRSWQLNYDPKF